MEAKTHYSSEEYEQARQHSIENRQEIKKSKQVLCYYCKRVYTSNEIKDYATDEKDDTAICPHCNVDTVIGDASGLPVTCEHFAKHIHWYGFEHWHKPNGCLTARYPSCLWCWDEFDKTTSDVIYPTERINIDEITLLNDICPFEMEGYTDKDEYVYVGERCGRLRIDIDDVVQFCKRGLHDFYGYKDLKTITSEWFSWPEEPSQPNESRQSSQSSQSTQDS